VKLSLLIILGILVITIFSIGAYFYFSENSLSLENMATNSFFSGNNFQIINPYQSNIPIYTQIDDVTFSYQYKETELIVKLGVENPAGNEMPPASINGLGCDKDDFVKGFEHYCELKLPNTKFRARYEYSCNQEMNINEDILTCGQIKIDTSTLKNQVTLKGVYEDQITGLNISFKNNKLKGDLVEGQSEYVYWDTSFNLINETIDTKVLEFNSSIERLWTNVSDTATFEGQINVTSDTTYMYYETDGTLMIGKVVT